MSVVVQRLGVPPAALLIDIGNTRVGMAAWYEKSIHPSRSLTLEQLQDEPEWIVRAWGDLPLESNRYAMISSVSPPRLEAVTRLLAAHCDEAELVVIGRDIEPPIQAAVPEPAKIGTDRLCSAAAAYQKVQGACVVASFGTALTIDLVSDDGQFMGGAILPGMGMSARALHEYTALLPEVAVEAPQETWGTGTEEAIRVGVFCGIAGAVREIVERYATKIGKWPPLLLTGGDAHLFAETLDFASALAPDLCLRGIALVMERATAETETP